MLDFAGWLATQFLSLLTIIIVGVGIGLLIVGLGKIFSLSPDDSEDGAS